MRYILTGLIIISAILSPTNILAGEHYSFKHIDNHHGLSANNVKCITRDHLGFMWFGTKNGLNRYDGNQIRRFDCFDTKLNRGNNNIGALYEDEHSNLWIGTDRGIYIYNLHSDSINFVGLVSSDGACASNWVQRISGDRKGNVWALIPDEGVYRYFDKSVQHYVITKSENPKESFPSDLLVDRNGTTWVVTAKSGIFKYDNNADRFIKLKPISTEQIDVNDIHFCCIGENDEGHIMMGSIDGYIYSYDPKSNTLTRIKFSEEGRSHLRYIECFDDELWIGTYTGLYIINRTTGTETHLKSDNLNRFSLSDNIIYCIYRDIEGGAWIGTMFGGVNYLSRSKFRFINYGIDTNLSSNLIIGLACDRDGKIWIGTENAGVNTLDPKSAVIKQASNFDPSDNIVLSMASYNGNIYTSLSRKGLIKTDPNGVSTQIFPTAPKPDNNVYSYLIDSKGNEWVGQGYALYRRNKGEADFRHVINTHYDWIYHILETPDGIIWLGTMGCGIWRYNPANGEFKNYSYDHAAQKPTGLRSNSISSIMLDSQGNIWVSTDRGGLSLYNKATDDFTTFGIAEGLPDDCVYSVLEDGNGYLWFGTNKGLVKFSPTTYKVQVFTEEDGLIGNQYNYKSAIKTSDGRFWFGTINGVVSFYPKDYTGDNTTLPLFTTELRQFKKDSIRASLQNILFADEIKLNYNESTFSITIASPQYRQPGRVAFSYRLIPINREWITLANNEISFTNLSSGEYTLEVKVDNGDMSNTHSLKITILPPWWESTWAYCIYTLIFVAIAVLWFFWYRNRKRQELLSLKDQKEKEAYRTKINFFTEIAHEIRTPLTLINLPLEAIEDIGVDNPDIKHYLKVSRQNTQRLLELTSQLLDFEKIDSNSHSIKNENVNIVTLVQDIADRFEPTIRLNEKCLSRQIDNDPLSVSIDREALTKIISNLLNNALKYSNHTIQLILTQSEDSFVIKVISDGEKIPENERTRIFRPFYQTEQAEEAKNGIGIGLSLARALATLLDGTLILDDNDDEFNTFVLTLPKTTPIPKPASEQKNEINDFTFNEETNQAKTYAGIYSILLVEDNTSILQFLAEQLRRIYLVDTATNGQEAIQKLKDNHFDIVITDIMMPMMDGFELCRQIKEDVNLSHIPIIFITAKNDLDSKIKGLQYGAEAYIEKPFSIKYFVQQIRTLLDNRRRERNSYSKNPFFTSDNMQLIQSDEEFMQKVHKVIEDNISNENFNVDMMCSILCMSRSSLLRKIKQLFELSPIELIRLMKLKKAAELIQTGQYLIGDIGEMVGFSTPSYFSKMFFKQFGVSPKDFEKQCKQKNKSIINSKSTKP